jgi:hypothetical protein
MTERAIVQPEGFSLPMMGAGYTNRKAKRWAGKRRRRERLQSLKTGKAYAALGRRILRAMGGAEVATHDARA